MGFSLCKAPLAVLVLVVCFYDCNSQGGNHEMEWWQKTILYQIYPRSFKDSDGDGIGDLKGIISKLEYLKDTGIEATWLSPIFQSPLVDFGYDVSNFTAIHNEYGTMQDFDKLVVEAKKLGIKIILDFIPNHTSDECEWFTKSINRVDGYDDFYVWHDGKVDSKGKRLPPNNWQSVFYGSAWTWNAIRQQYYLHQFTKEQPDLNYRNPKVIEAMDNVMKFWLDKGVDGFRIDAVIHIYEDEHFRDEPETGLETDPNSYEFTHHTYTKDLPEGYELIYHWRDILNDYKKKNGGDTRIMLTEGYSNITFTVEYYQNEAGRKGAHLPFNFLLITDIDEESDARDFVSNIQMWLAYMPVDATANWVMGNHDRPRLATRFGTERVDGLNMLLLTLPGVGITYNGEEIGMLDHPDITWEQTKDPAGLNTNREVFKKFTRDPCRTPFQWDATANAGFSGGNSTWLPVHPNYRELNLADQKTKARSHYKLYKRLAKLRKHPTLQNGNIYPMAITRRVLAYKRELHGQDTFVVVINLAEREVTVDLSVLRNIPDNLVVIAAGAHSQYNEGVSVQSKTLNLKRYDALLLAPRALLMDG